MAINIKKVLCEIIIGLYSDADIREIIIYSKIEVMCKNLVDAAKPVSRDNITVIAVKR